MNRFKKACEELSVYLNKDAKGIELLSRVTRIGNEVRNELASATDAKERSDITCKMHMEVVAKASSELSKANAERQQHLDTIASLRCKVENYEKHRINDEEQASASAKLEITPKEVSKLLRAALKDGQCIKPEGNVTPEDLMELTRGFAKLRPIILHNNISNLSHPELAKLGRLVAIHAIMSGCAVVTTPVFSSLYDPNNPETQAVEATNRLFMKFIKPSCDFSEMYRKAHMAVESKAHPIVPGGTRLGGFCKHFG